MAYLLFYVDLSVFICAFFLDFSCSVYGPFRFISDMSVCPLSLAFWSSRSFPCQQDNICIHLWQCKPMTVYNITMNIQSISINIVIIISFNIIPIYKSLDWPTTGVQCHSWRIAKKRIFASSRRRSTRRSAWRSALFWKTNKQLFGKQTNII